MGRFVQLSAILFALWAVHSVCIATSTTDDCPGSLKRDKYLQRFGDTCFRFVTYRSKSRANAKKYCEKNGGTLAMPKSKKVNEFLTRKLKHTYHSWLNVWIGLTDMDEENVYVWDDGTDLDYQNFGPREGPRGSMRFVHRSEDCVVLVPLNGKWNDVRCKQVWVLPFRKILPFICQYQIPSTTKNVVKPTDSSINLTVTTTPPPMIMMNFSVESLTPMSTHTTMTKSTDRAGNTEKVTTLQTDSSSLLPPVTTPPKRKMFIPVLIKPTPRVISIVKVPKTTTTTTTMTKATNKTTPKRPIKN